MGWDVTGIIELDQYDQKGFIVTLLNLISQLEKEDGFYGCLSLSFFTSVQPKSRKARKKARKSHSNITWERHLYNFNANEENIDKIIETLNNNPQKIFKEREPDQIEVEVAVKRYGYSNFDLRSSREQLMNPQLLDSRMTFRMYREGLKGYRRILDENSPIISIHAGDDHDFGAAYGKFNYPLLYRELKTISRFAKAIQITNSDGDIYLFLREIGLAYNLVEDVDKMPQIIDAESVFKCLFETENANFNESEYGVYITGELDEFYRELRKIFTREKTN